MLRLAHGRLLGIIAAAVGGLLRVILRQLKNRLKLQLRAISELELELTPTQLRQTPTPPEPYPPHIQSFAS